jgi:hypothetical protein
MSKMCTGCGKPTADTITAYGLTLPYHPQCAIEAERDLRIVLRWPDAFMSRCCSPVLGSGFRADEI